MGCGVVFQYMHNICCDQIGPISISPASDMYLALGAFESLCNNYFEILNSELLTNDFYCAIEYEQYSFFVVFFLKTKTHESQASLDITCTQGRP